MANKVGRNRVPINGTPNTVTMSEQWCTTLLLQNKKTFLYSLKPITH
jgi:hypothetical protein